MRTIRDIDATFSNVSLVPSVRSHLAICLFFVIASFFSLFDSFYPLFLIYLIYMQEAYKNNLESGSTATIVLIADGQILVANVGDSKALVCSERFHSPEEFKGLNFC